MIPKVIHYCWFGREIMPELALKCIGSWHRFMPDWKYKLWNEDNFDVNSVPYTKEAYEAGKYAFVSDYVRLKVLYEEGGLYLDTDVEVFRSFLPLMEETAFAGFEGSKQLPIGTCVMASVPQGEWIGEQFLSYQGRCFIFENGQLDLTTNVVKMSEVMKKNGFVQNGFEQMYKDAHFFPIEYFSPRLTTGEYHRTENTYCDHLGLASWSDGYRGWKEKFLSVFGENMRVRIIKLKRIFLG